MTKICKFIFLVSLLICEWAGDPFFGRSLFSRAMSSQETLLAPVHHWSCAGHRITPSPLWIIKLLGDMLAVYRPASLPLLFKFKSLAPSGSLLVYILMSILR